MATAKFRNCTPALTACQRSKRRKVWGVNPLSRIMLGLQGSYTQTFNRRHGRVGHLFQGQYKSQVVQKDPYLLALVRYIHENPVLAGIVGEPPDYR